MPAVLKAGSYVSPRVDSALPLVDFPLFSPFDGLKIAQLTFLSAGRQESVPCRKDTWFSCGMPSERKAWELQTPCPDADPQRRGLGRSREELLET